MNNSFLEMFDYDQVELSILIHQASLSEFIDADGLKEFSPSIHTTLRGEIITSLRAREYDNEVVLSEKPVRIIVEKSEYSELGNREAKFPLGMVKFEQSETYIRLFVRHELFMTISQQLFAVVSGSMRFKISIPFVDSYQLDLYYPILGYSFHVGVKMDRT